MHFPVPDDLAEVFAHEAGQHVTIVREEDGEEVRRSYSICVPARSGELAVGVRHLPGGRFSGFVADGLRAGDLLDVLPPAGRFGPEISPGASRHHAFVAAGSGITPVISIVATVLAEEPGSRCTVVYGNRRTDTIMFVEELEDLKNRYPSRLQLVHVLSRESQPVPLLEGRLDAGRLGALLDALLPPDEVDEWYLCGPFGMVQDARALLRERGVATEHIHRELFHADAAPVAARRCPGVRQRSRDGHDRARRPPLDVPGRRRLDPRGRAAQPARRALRVQGRRLRDVPVPDRRGRGGDGPLVRPRGGRGRRGGGARLPGAPAIGEDRARLRRSVMGRRGRWVVMEADADIRRPCCAAGCSWEVSGAPSSAATCA